MEIAPGATVLIDVKSSKGVTVSQAVRGCDGDPKFLTGSDAPRFLNCCVLGNSHSSVYSRV